MKALGDGSAKLIGWIDSQLKKLDEKAEIRLTLRHVAGAKTSVVNRWTVSRSSEANELAVEIGQAAQVDTHFMGGGVKRYELVASVDGEHVGRYGLRVEDVDQEEDDSSNGRYQLNDAAVALVKQSQDHVSGLVRAMVTLMVGTDKSRLAELDRLAQRNETIETKLDKMREMIERAQDKQFERDMQRDKLKSEERRIDEAFATGRVMFPFLVNALAKKALLPTGDNSVLKEALRPVMSEMTNEQLAKLKEVLTPSQIVGLLEVWNLLSEDKKTNGQDKN